MACREASGDLKKALGPLYREAFMTFAKRTYEDVLKRASKDADEIIAWEKLAAQMIAEVGARKVVRITDASVDLIQTVITRGIADGLSIPNIAREIRRDVGEINTTTRATRIARTETIGAANYGAVEGARATGLPLVKNWLATTDPRTRASHVAANGQTVGMDDSFRVGGALLRFPGDPNGPAHEVINCRCATTFEVTDG